MRHTEQASEELEKYCERVARELHRLCVGDGAQRYFKSGSKESGDERCERFWR